MMTPVPVAVRMGAAYAAQLERQYVSRIPSAIWPVLYDAVGELLPVMAGLTAAWEGVRC